MAIDATAARQPLVARQGRDVGVAVAAVAAAAAVVLLGLGGALWAWAEHHVDGYFVGSTHRHSTSTHALVSRDLAVETRGLVWPISHGQLGTIRLDVAPIDTRRRIFVGIAETESRASLDVPASSRPRSA
jgi:hypothetical protein